MARATFNLVFEEHRLLADDVRHLVFRREDGQPFDFIPGQFIRLHLTVDGEALLRSYSLANAPHNEPSIEVAVSYVKGGRASEVLFQLMPGDVMEASGPFGRLILPEEPVKRFIFIATGTGVTPYRSMLPALAERIKNENCEVVLVQGVRHRADLLYGEEFLEFQSQHPNFRYFACYSQEKGIDLNSFEKLGRVPVGLDELTLDPDSDLVYLCGNPNMIDDVFSRLTDQGFATSRIKREKYISPGGKKA